MNQFRFRTTTLKEIDRCHANYRNYYPSQSGTTTFPSYIHLDHLRDNYLNFFGSLSEPHSLFPCPDERHPKRAPQSRSVGREDAGEAKRDGARGEKKTEEGENQSPIEEREEQLATELDVLPKQALIVKQQA